MKKVLVPLADGFEEIESTTIMDVLRRAGVDVVIAGIKPGPLKGAHGVQLIPDVTLQEVKDQGFDMIVLPGGQPGVDNLRKNQDVIDILKKMHQKKKIIGAICAAPLVLRDAGLISGVNLTSYPGIESDLKEGHYQQDRIVMDGHIITSRGPGTALEFSLKLVEILCGKEKAEALAGALLARY